jgi:hypothetical protein
MPEGNEAKFFEAFFWLVAVLLLVWPLTSADKRPGAWLDSAQWIAQIALAAAAGLFFTLTRTRPDKLPRKTGIAIGLLIVFLLFVHASQLFTATL